MQRRRRAEGGGEGWWEDINSLWWGFEGLGLVTMVPLMKLLAGKVRWNSAAAAEGGRRGGGMVGGHQVLV